MVRIVPGLHMADRTGGGRAWLFADGITCVLFDTGAPDGTLGVGELLQSAGHQPHQVRAILLTHAHRGHAGNAAGLRELTGAWLGASAATAAALADPPPPPPHHRLPRLFAGGPMHPVHVDRILEPGDVLDIAGGIEVLDAPGHCSGALAFHLRRVNALVAGDALSVGRRGLTAPPARRCEDPEQAASTAARLARLPVRVVAPGHGLATLEGRPPSAVPPPFHWRDTLRLNRRR